MEELEKKRIEVLKAIKPICEVFEIEYDYIVKQAKKLYKNQKVSPEEINLRYDALKRKELFKSITNLNFNTFVAYRHLIAIAITFENDHRLNVDYYLKKYGLF